MSNDKLAPCAPDLGRRLDEAVEFVGLEAACSTGEQRRTYTWMSELMKEARQAIATNAKATAWAEGYRWGVLDERTSAANIGIAGFNAKVEPARQNPYGVAPALAAHEAEKQAGPVAVVKLMETGGNAGIATVIREIDDPLRERLRPGQMLYLHPSPLTEQDKEDAENYRWLASNCDGDAQDDFIQHIARNVLSRAEFDTAIRAARAKKEQQ